MANIRHCLSVTEDENGSESLALDAAGQFVDDSTQSTRMNAITSTACGNTYESNYIGGQARVLMGNVYYINHPTERRRSFAPSTSVNSFPSFNTMIRTERRQSQYPLLPWILSLTQDYTTYSSSRGIERLLSWQIRCGSRYVVFASVFVEVSGDLRLYRPRLRNVVPESSRLMAACTEGDLTTVRQLLSTKMANPNDVTQSNHSALYFAINGGHEHIVRELLAHGADVNQGFGLHDSSPLAWALYRRNSFLVRLLMQNGACIQHVSRRCWSLLFYLWDTEHNPQPPCIDFLTTLRSADPDLFTALKAHVVDSEGWVLFNRVACAGMPEELDFLIKCGADVSFKNEYDWTSLFDAVYGGKLGNVQVLVAFFPDFLELRDTRGWTLLHVAAEEGHDDIVRYLLLQGADPEAESWPSYDETPKTLQGVCCTPVEAARAQSEDRAERYLRIVAECLYDQRAA